MGENIQRQKHLLIVIPTLGSFKAFLASSVQAYINCGWKVSLICDCSGNKRDDQNISIYDLKMPRGLNFKDYIIVRRRLKKLISEISPTIIHAHFSAAALALAFAKNSTWPYMITTIQGVVFTAIKKGMYASIIKAAEIYAFKKFNRTYVLTKDDYFALKKTETNVFLQKATGFGCDLDRFNLQRITEVEKKKIRDRLDINPSDKVMIFIGRLVNFKGIHIVFRSYLNALKQLPNLKLIICGEFDSLHKSGLSENEIAILKTHSNIRWLGFTQEIPQYLSISDINVFPSIREGMPVNLMESLAMGVPVITFNTRGCRDIVTDGVTGMVLDIQPDISGAIIDFFLDKKRIALFKENAINQRLRFDRSNYVSETLELYNTHGI